MTVEKLEIRASYYWDEFYKQNGDKFFKDRHWFRGEFEQLDRSDTVLELGCGTGSSVYPLLELRDTLRVYACDFAPSAVELVKSNPLYASGRVTAFVADITKDDLKQHVPLQCIDSCLMIFVLSAISPSRMKNALLNLRQCMKPGGAVLFRDYCTGDLAQKRLGKVGKQQQIEENFYARGDGTRAYYFTKSMLREVFESCGFIAESIEVITRSEVNRRSQVVRERRYLQAVFIRDDHSDTLDRMDPERDLQSAVPVEQREVTVSCSVDEKYSFKFGCLYFDDFRIRSDMELYVDTEKVLASWMAGEEGAKYVRNSVVVDIGSSHGLPAVASLGSSWRTTVLMNSDADLSIFKKNIRRNSSKFMYEKLRIWPFKYCLAALSQNDIIRREHVEAILESLGIPSMSTPKLLICIVLPLNWEEEGDTQVTLARELSRCCGCHCDILISCHKSLMSRLEKHIIEDYGMKLDSRIFSCQDRRNTMGSGSSLESVYWHLSDEVVATCVHPD